MLKKLKRVFKAKKRHLVPRGPRVEIHPLSGILFALCDPLYPRIDFEVVNLSENGIGLCNAPVVRPPKAGTRLRGTMILPDQRIPTELLVVHSSESSIGCAFPHGALEIQRQIQNLFQLEISALNLAEVPARDVKPEDDGTARIFRGRNNCELFIVEQDGALVRFQLSFFGNYIEGGANLKTSFGFLTATSLVRMVPELSPDVLGAALRFLDHVPQITPLQRTYLQKAIKRR